MTRSPSATFALGAPDEDVLAFERRMGRRTAADRAQSHGATRRTLHLPAGTTIFATLLSTAAPRAMDGTLAPDEGLVLRLAGRG